MVDMNRKAVKQPNHETLKQEKCFGAPRFTLHASTVQRFIF